MKLREEFLRAYPYCQWFAAYHELICVTHRCGSGFVGCKLIGPSIVEFVVPPSTEIHHKKGRGKYLLDTSTWMAVSRTGHDWIHANPKLSYEKGYMLPRS